MIVEEGRIWAKEEHRKDGKKKMIKTEKRGRNSRTKRKKREKREDGRA